MAGRKPKPTAIKKLEGNPGKKENCCFKEHFDLNCVSGADTYIISET